jgi:LysM repeat protein
VRKWTTSACVVLAWSIMPLLAAADLAVPGHSAQATTTTSITQITLAKAPTSPGSPGSPNTNDHAILASKSAAGTTATPEAGKPAATWTVRQGDSLSAIATASGVPGGWQSLYAANRQAIGPDPDVIHPGTILTLPRRQAPMRYTVRPGDTLSGIAAALAIPGGWQELYAANRQAIGPDPNAIRPGTVLTAGAASTASTAGGESPQPASHKQHEASPPAHADSPKPSIQPTARASEPQRAPAANPTPAHATPPNPAPAATRAMPNWLKGILIAAGLLAAIAFAIEPVAVFTRRRRPADKTPKTSRSTPRSPANTQERDPTRVAAQKTAEEAAQEAAARARIIFADHERLIVTYSSQDDAVYVFTPPGEDPGAVLRAARLILPEDRYEELAGHLGLPSAMRLE